MNPSDLPARERAKIEEYTKREQRDCAIVNAHWTKEQRLSADHAYHQRWARWHRTRSSRHGRAANLQVQKCGETSDVGYGYCGCASHHIEMAKWHERRADYHSSIWN